MLNNNNKLSVCDAIFTTFFPEKNKKLFNLGVILYQMALGEGEHIDKDIEQAIKDEEPRSFVYSILVIKNPSNDDTKTCAGLAVDIYNFVTGRPNDLGVFFNDRMLADMRRIVDAVL